jgi:hypothetical protein
LNAALDTIRSTVATIAEAQLDDGCIPWFEGGHADPWDHVEAAMALDVGGMHDAAARAYLWLAKTQRPDGSWPAKVRRDEIVDPTLDTNFCAYIATGLWHHHRTSGDRDLIEELWGTLVRAIDFALDLQAPDGSIYWARDKHGRPWPAALLTSSSCIHLSLRCAIALAETLGESRPDWELGASKLSVATAHPTPATFDSKDRFAMDWYYPVLGGILTGDTARARLRTRWDDFIVPGRGTRCVVDRPWVTSAETCELVIALDVADLRDEAEAVFDWVHQLRHEDGSYWTGATFPDGTVWPRERPTWGSAAMVLASDVLLELTAGSTLWRGEGLPETLVSEPVGDAP